MKRFKGKGVFGAVAIGPACLYRRQAAEFRRERISDPDSEIARVEAAKAAASKQLSDIYEKALAEVGEEHAQIFEIHMMMLEDDDYNESIRNMISNELVNAEYAVSETCAEFSGMFASMDDEYMQASAADVKDISQRLIACLSGADSDNSHSAEKVVICADDLSPSETVTIDKDRVLAFVTAFGSSNSHTAILARNMSIPAVIGAGEDFISAVSDGCRLIVDGRTGDIIIDPDAETEKEYTAVQQEDDRRNALLRELKGKPDVTRDGREIKIFANIGGVDGIDAAIANDAGGIGLFRSEFLYLESQDYPTEEQQFEAYKKVLERMKGKKSLSGHLISVLIKE